MGRVIISDLKQRANLIDIVKASVELKKKGQFYIGLCPFHNDSKPSFWCNEERFGCFACQVKGDVIDFVRLRYNLGFKEAVDQIAGYIGGATYIPQEDYQATLIACKICLPLRELAYYIVQRILPDTVKGAVDVLVEPNEKILQSKTPELDLVRAYLKDYGTDDHGAIMDYQALAIARVGYQRFSEVLQSIKESMVDSTKEF
ncbi:MAG: hypothetical protein D6732_07985 [Methanobacteriota archaeon]|nr:MAG: hypothetical protein D6732_07985 [Euryarchaeota archaeon]